MKKIFGRDFLKSKRKFFLIFLFAFCFLAMGGGDAEAQACVTGKVDRSFGGDPIDMLMDVHVVGNRAFVVDRWHTWTMSDTFHTIDITTPATPFRTGGCNLPNWSYDLDISGNYAYVVGSSGFYVVDITTPDAPNCNYASCPACITDNDTDEKKSIHISGSFAYVTDSNDGLKVIDISNPLAPFLAWSNNAAAFWHVYVSGSHAYAVSGSTLYAINTASHVVDWSVAVNGICVAVSADGNHAYVESFAAAGGTFRVINTNTHSIVGSCDSGAGSGYDLHVVGNEVYVAGYRCDAGWCGGTSIDLYRVNVAAPAAPFLSGACDVTGGAGYGVFVSGAYAYIADGLGGFVIIGTAGLVPPCNWKDDACDLYGCTGQMGQSCQPPGCTDSMNVCDFGDTNCKADPSCDTTDPTITLIDALESDTTTSIPNGGTVCDTDVPARIEVEATDAGTGISEITIYWSLDGGVTWNSDSDFDVGSFMTNPIALVDGDNVVYYAEVFDDAVPRNMVDTLPNRSFDVINCCVVDCATDPDCRAALVLNSYDTTDECCGQICVECDAGYVWNAATSTCDLICVIACATGPYCRAAAIPNSHITGAECCGLQCIDCNAGYTWDGSDCVAICVWQDDGCGLYGCIGQMGQSCGPPGCLGGPCVDGATQCVPDPSCIEDCNDIGVIDEDGDGDANCDDAGDCFECDPCDGIAGNVCMGGNCIPLAAENCTDGMDNDCNSLTDCADVVACPCSPSGCDNICPPCCLGGDDEDCPGVCLDCSCDWDDDCPGHCGADLYCCVLCAADPDCCNCSGWSAWTDVACGPSGGCPGHAMHQVHTQTCIPAFCQPHSEDQCVANHPSCASCNDFVCNGLPGVGCSPFQDPDVNGHCLDCACITDTDCIAEGRTCFMDTPPSCCASGCAIRDPDCPGPAPDPKSKPMECCRLDREYPDTACIGGGFPGGPGNEIVGPAAKTGDSCKIKGESVLINCGTKDWGTLCMIESIYKIANWLFYFFFAAAVLMISISAYYFLGSSGDSQKVAVSKNMLYWIGGAVVLAIMSKIIPIIIMSALV